MKGYHVEGRRKRVMKGMGSGEKKMDDEEMRREGK